MKSRILFGVAALACCAGMASAQVANSANFKGRVRHTSLATDMDILVDQFTDTTLNNGVASQNFTDFDTFDAWHLDDFTLSQAYMLDTILGRGFNTVAGGEAFNIDLEVIVFGHDAANNRPNVNDIKFQVSSTIPPQAGGDITVNLGGQALDAGTYWIGVRPERPFTGGGQWFHFRSTKLGLGISGDINGAKGYFYVPGNGFGCASSLVGTDDICFGAGAPATDAAYQLVGTAGGGGGCGCVCNYDTSTGTDVCDFFDFITFQDLFAAGDDCGCNLDTSTGMDVCDFFDFIIFQDLFSVGC